MTGTSNKPESVSVILSRAVAMDSPAASAKANVLTVAEKCGAGSATTTSWWATLPSPIYVGSTTSASD